MGIKKSQELSISSNINNAKYNSNDETPIASGGTEGTDDGHRYHKFTSSGTLTVQKSGIAEVFVLGGGGGAGGGVSGGGGAGAAILIKEYPLVVGSWTVTVGAGGAGGNGQGNDGSNGGDSVLTNSTYTLTAKGGGYSGGSSVSSDRSSNSGGCGGGGSGYWSNHSGGDTTQTVETNDGVNTYEATGIACGGDPDWRHSSRASRTGAGGSCGLNNSDDCFKGNDFYWGDGQPAKGLRLDLDGTYRWYGVGGNSAFETHGAQDGAAGPGANADANRGGGGGGKYSHSSGSDGGDGGSGVVIVRYKI